MAKILVFDFDGTLADSKQLYLWAINSFLLRNGYRISKKVVAKNLGPRLDVMLINLGVRKKDLAKIQQEINLAVVKKATTLEICPYVKSTLKRLSSKHILTLITNSKGSFVKRFLLKHNLLNYFSELSCAEFKTKDKAFRHLFKKYAVKPPEVIYIADKKEDIAIAKRVGCKVIIVLSRAWDRKAFKQLNKYKECTIRNLKELNL